MAMAVGASDDDSVISAINTTPLVDVMLVLLIIFLITIPVVTTSIPVQLPKERNEVRETKPENIVLSVDLQDRIYWNDLRIPTTAALIERLKKVSVLTPQPEVQIRGDGDVKLDINTTPLIDVMLVLLVMLIITIPIQLHSVNLNMPIGNPPPPLVLPEVVKIDIDDRGAIYWNGEVVPDRATLEQKITAAASQQVQPEVHLRPDKESKYAVAAAVMASAQRLGLTKIGIVGSEQFIE